MAMPYFPATYGMNYPYNPQMYQNQYIPQNQQQGGGLIWVQGIEAAKSHPVSAGQSVLLMDSESNRFYIKSADASGMPLPLRVFDYTEHNVAVKQQETRTEHTVDLSAYVTRDELEARISEIVANKRNADEQRQNNNGGNRNGK